MIDRGKLCRIAEKNERRKDLLEILELAIIKHRRFIDKPDIKRLFATFPPGNKIRSTKARRSKSAGYRLVKLIKRPRPFERLFRQTFNFRLVAISHKPFRDPLIFRVVDRRVDNPMDRRRWHPAHPQHACRLVRRREDRKGAPVLAPLALIIAGYDINTRRLERLDQFCEQKRLARSGLADHRRKRQFTVAGWCQNPLVQINTAPAQKLGDRVIGFGLVMRKGQRACHTPTLQSPLPKHQRALPSSGRLCKLRTIASAKRLLKPHARCLGPNACALGNKTPGLFAKPPKTDANPITPLAFCPKNLGRRANHPINPNHTRIKHAHIVLNPKSGHDFTTTKHQRTSCFRLGIPREAEPRAFPDKWRRHTHPICQIKEMLVHHTASRRRQQAHRPAMRPIRLFPDYIERVHRVVFITLFPIGVHIHFPAKAGLELVGAIKKHGAPQ